MDGWIIKGGNEAYGQIIQPVGDVNNDGVADWLVVHNRVDTSFAPKTAKEVLLYYGVRGGVPSPKSGKRIGPEELGSETAFLCAGDFDSDSHIDLALAVELFSDTLNGIGQYHPKRLVIYWGNNAGLFSNSDTSQLLNSSEYWLGFHSDGGHVFQEFDANIHSILIWGQGTLDHDTFRETAKLHRFDLLAGRRWGRDGQLSSPNWQWWGGSIR